MKQTKQDKRLATIWQFRYSRGPKATTYRIRHTYGRIFGFKRSRGNLFPKPLGQQTNKLFLKIKIEAKVESREQKGGENGLHSGHMMIEALTADINPHSNRMK